MHQAESKGRNGGRDLLIVSNDAIKLQLVRLMGEFSPLIQQHYGDIVSTAHTAAVLRDWLPAVKALAPGPEFGDVEAVQYCRERRAQGRDVHCFVFLDHRLEPHQIFKDMLATALLQLNVCWFPTPMTARIYLETLRESHESHPECGDFKDNASVLDVATHKLEAGETEAGLTTLYTLWAHISHTQESQSRTWLVPKIRALLLRYSGN
jgi:hypothetical protein